MPHKRVQPKTTAGFAQIAENFSPVSSYTTVTGVSSVRLKVDAVTLLLSEVALMILGALLRGGRFSGTSRPGGLFRDPLWREPRFWPRPAPDPDLGCRLVCGAVAAALLSTLVPLIFG